MACCALSTVDNPFDPFNEFAKWFMFDQMNNYKCSEKVALRAFVDDNSMSTYEIEEEIERVIDEIVENDESGLYVKVVFGKFLYVPSQEYENRSEIEEQLSKKPIGKSNESQKESADNDQNGSKQTEK